MLFSVLGQVNDNGGSVSLVTILIVLAIIALLVFIFSKLRGR